MIYFVQAGEDGPIKIGHAVNVTKRIATIQTGAPEKLRLLATVEGGRDDEARIHRRFSAHRQQGEWFAPHPDILFAVRLAEHGADSEQLATEKVRMVGNADSDYVQVGIVRGQSDDLIILDDGTSGVSIRFEHEQAKALIDALTAARTLSGPMPRRRRRVKAR